jgi:hypothetical protein
MAQSETYLPLAHPSFKLLPLTARTDSRREHWHPPPDDVGPAARAPSSRTPGNDRRSRSGDA